MGGSRVTDRTRKNGLQKQVHLTDRKEGYSLYDVVSDQMSEETRKLGKLGAASEVRKISVEDYLKEKTNEGRK